ncbi:MAG TPA: hypothetical protein VKP67_21125 [Xanthobacteraceae bacterium]|nr:hypothetical protein [Xanthobacteraceae bacterium]
MLLPGRRPATLIRKCSTSIILALLRTRSGIAVATPSRTGPISNSREKPADSITGLMVTIPGRTALL